MVKKSILISLSLILASGLLSASESSHGEGVPAHLVADYGNFLILFVILFFALKGPFKTLFRSRSEIMRQKINDASEQHEEAKNFYDTYNEKTKNIDGALRSLLDEYAKVASLEKSKILQDANQQKERLLKECDVIIAQEELQLKEKIKIEILDQTVKNAETLIQDNIRDEDQNKVVETYLQNLKKVAS